MTVERKQAGETFDGLNLGPLSDEEAARMLAWLAEAQEGRDKLLNQRGGRLFGSSGELINELRDERSDHS